MMRYDAQRGAELDVEYASSVPIASDYRWPDTIP